MIPSGRDPAQSSFRHVGEMKGFTRQGRSWPPGRTLRSRRGLSSLSRIPSPFPILLGWSSPRGWKKGSSARSPAGETLELSPDCAQRAGLVFRAGPGGGRARVRPPSGPGGWACGRRREGGARLWAHETPRLPTCLFFPLGSYVFKRRCCLPFLYLVYTAASGTKGF